MPGSGMKSLRFQKRKPWAIRDSFTSEDEPLPGHKRLAKGEQTVSNPSGRKRQSDGKA